MIIPVKCFTCGTVLGDKYRFYLQEVIKKKMANDEKVEKVIYLTKESFDLISINILKIILLAV